MKDKILRFARGDFSEAGAVIALSEKQISFEVEEGKTYQGSIYIGSEDNLMLKGLLYISCPYLSVMNDQFAGKEAKVNYTFSAKELTAGETVTGHIDIITNLGAVTVPVEAVVTIPCVTTKAGIKISDLAGFAEFASKNKDEACDIFMSDSFEKVFLYRDIEKQMLYKTLKKGPDIPASVEEFLVAIHKKTRVMLAVDRNNIEYKDCYSPFEDEVHIDANTWGLTKIHVQTDAPFIRIEHNVIECDGDSLNKGSMVVRYIIDAANMKRGLNTGYINVKTSNQHFKIKISAFKHDEGEIRKEDRSRFLGKILRLFLELKKGKIGEKDYTDEIDRLLLKYKRKLSDDIVTICQVYVAIMRGKTDSVKGLINDLTLYENNVKRSDRDYIFYVAILYVKYLAMNSDGEESRALLVDKVRDIYNRRCRHVLLLWLLLFMDPAYQEDKVLFDEVLRHIKAGSTSPVLYLLLCRVIKKNPEFIHEWDDSMIYPLAWGIKNDIVDEEMGDAFAFHVSRTKTFNLTVYKSLSRLYDTYKNDDILATICMMLVRLGKCDSRYTRWFELGIEKQFKITNIYESYMSSLNSTYDKTIPEQVTRYFMYGNRLPKREKEILFASVIKDKTRNPSIYRAYGVMISNFARKQLEKGELNDSLAIIYEDSIRLSTVDETIAVYLPEVMFKIKVQCLIDSVKGVIVTCREFEDEVYVPFEDGVAYVDVVSDDYKIVIVDENDNRLTHPGYYTTRKMLHMDSFAAKCYEIAPDNDRLLAYIYCKCEKEYNDSERSVAIRRKAWKELHLRFPYEQKNYLTLLEYYYEHAEGEYLDELLSALGERRLNKRTKRKRNELLVLRGMYDDALASTDFDELEEDDSRHLARICEEMINAPEELEENDKLLKAAAYVFEKGSYTDKIIRYLAKYYMGPSKNMYSIWKTAQAFDIKCDEICEKLLAQVLFAEEDIEGTEDVLDYYLKHGTDKVLKKGFISYLAYRYVTVDKELSETAWNWIENNILKEYNIICTLAVIKRLSFADNLTDDEKEFCDIKVNQFVKKGIIFPFFLRFAKYFRLPGELDGRQIIMCVWPSGRDINIRYKYAGGSIKIAPMKESYYGVYIYELVIFENEKVIYEFFTNKNGKKNLLGSGTISYEEISGRDITRFDMINTMIRHYNNGDDEKLTECLETYVKLDEASHSLFKIL